MSIPTVGELCAAVPGALFPAAGSVMTDLPISAVHVSELADPTGYLSGGELLLTTGLALPDAASECETYVLRLQAAGVAALGIGLGPSHATIPEVLTAACAKHEVCLVVVPPGAAFLTVTKAYWTARSRSTQRELTDAISSHRSLVDAMVSKDPVGETMKALSRAIGAWVARLDPAGVVERVFPAGRVADAMGLADQITTLRAAGTHSSATFPVGEEVVAISPLAFGNRVVGFIAIGSTAPLGVRARQLVLTAGALLSLDSVQRQRADAATVARMQSVTSLLDMGFVEPARRLAARLDLPVLGDTVQVLVVRSPRSGDVSEAVQGWMPGAMPGPIEDDRSWFVMPEVHPPADQLGGRLRKLDPRVTVALSDPVRISAVHAVRVGLFDHVLRLSPGSIAITRERPIDEDVVGAGVRRVIEHRRTDLTATLVAYLRHRGQWDATARDLGLHRNTVRHRMGTIRELIGVDLDDPDVTAPMWLYLRANGLT